MVDVGGKEVTQSGRGRGGARDAAAERGAGAAARAAIAPRRARCSTPRSSPGVMAAKRTHELIPFCHPLGIDNCAVEIEARARRHHSHSLPRLRASQDGRGDGSAHGRVRRGADGLRHVQGAVARHPDRERAARREDGRQAGLSSAHESPSSSTDRKPPRAQAPLYGLVLAGGRSTRMQRDKATLAVSRPHAARMGDGPHRAVRGACVRFGAAGPASRSRAREVSADRGHGRTTSAPSRESWPRRRRIRTWRGSCSRATCRSSMPPR